jgi:hypothetical protein
MFASLFAFSGFGPCGPSNPFGFIGVLTHIFPGMLVFAALNTFVKLPDIFSPVIIVVSQAIFWSGLTFVLLRIGQRLDKLDIAKADELRSDAAIKIAVKADKK